MEKQSCKDILELIAVSYEENRSYAFDRQLVDFVNRKEHYGETITEEDIKNLLDNFTFPDKFEWCMREYSRHISGYYSEKASQLEKEAASLINLLDSYDNGKEK